MSNSEQTHVGEKQYCASCSNAAGFEGERRSFATRYIKVRDMPMIRPKQISTAALSIVSGAILTAVLFFGAAPRLHAEDIDRCQRRVARADHELHEAIEKHGRHSRQAEHERRELHEARERCWREQHRWWDEHEHRWRSEHDWNERDHD
jgi:hypothetical protein